LKLFAEIDSNSNSKQRLAGAERRGTVLANKIRRLAPNLAKIGAGRAGNTAVKLENDLVPPVILFGSLGTQGGDKP